MKQNKQIVEDKLGITPDYQYQALRSKNFLQANWHGHKLLAIKILLKNDLNGDILDLGTGSGNFEVEMSHIAKRIVGVDYNLKALNFLKKKLREKKIKNVELVHLDIDNLHSLSKGKFDLIIMVDVIEHLSSKVINKLLEEFNGLLKKGGKVCIITPNYMSMWTVIEWISDKFHLLPAFAGEQHISKFTPINLEKIFTSNGFKIVYLRTFNTLSWLIPDKYLAAALCRLELGFRFDYGNLLISIFEKK